MTKSLTRSVREQRLEAETRSLDDTVIISSRAYKTDCYHEIDAHGNIACRATFRDEDEPRRVSRRKAMQKNKVPCGYPKCAASLDGDLPSR